MFGRLASLHSCFHLATNHLTHTTHILHISESYVSIIGKIFTNNVKLIKAIVLSIPSIALSIPTDVCHDLVYFLRCVFQRDISLRYTAEDCLKLVFFKNSNIPRSLCTRTFTQNSSICETTEQQPSSIFEGIFSCMISIILFKNIFQEILAFLDIVSLPQVKALVDYPKIHIVAHQILGRTFENQKYANTLELVFRRFDAICRYHSVNF